MENYCRLWLTRKAESYAARTGMDADTIFGFLARIMRERRYANPRDIHMAMIGDHYLRTVDGDELRPYNTPHTIIFTERGAYYLDAILARQESYWSD